MQTLFIGQQLIFLHATESTNTYATELLKNMNVAEGSIIYTNNQTQGKGQRGAVWSSEIGANITASCVLKPRFLDIKNVFYLSKISALALYDVLAELLPNSQFDIKIKWPNDILVNKKKIGGLLIENNLNKDYLTYSVVGIGFNVNQVAFEGLQNQATSLKILTNLTFDKTTVLEKICQHIEKWYLKLKAEKNVEINECYANRVFGMHKHCNFCDFQGQPFVATISSILNDGKLHLTLPDGTNRFFGIKEVKMIY